MESVRFLDFQLETIIFQFSFEKSIHFETDLISWFFNDLTVNAANRETSETLCVCDFVSRVALVIIFELMWW